MIDARTVIHFMQRKGYRPVSFRELAKQMHVFDEDERRALQAVVSELEADGVVRRRKKQALALARPTAFVTGVIDVKRRGFAFVRPVDREGDDIYVDPDSIGSALDEDMVLVETSKRRHRGRMLDAGRVVQVLQRRRQRLVGTFKSWRKRRYVVPDGMSFAAEIAVSGKDVRGAHEGDKVLVELDRRPSDRLSGHIVEVYGDGTDPSVDIPMVIAEFGLPDAFPEAVMSQVAALPDRVTKRDIKGRLDLRDDVTITIDPVSAQDFDDAISLTRTRGGWKLGVHIADVSHYVRPGSAVWVEAAKRTTSIYLPTHTIPMLPEKLSNGLCSLRPDEDRLTLSVLADLDAQGGMKHFRVVRSVIRSSKRLSYEEALEAVEGRRTSLGGPVVKLLKDAARLAKLLGAIRTKRGALELDLPEVELEYDKAGHLSGAHPLERDAAHRMIEEFMLLANECVARFAEDRGRRIVHRAHEAPDAERIQDLFFFARTLGIASDVRDTRHALQQIIESARSTPLSHAVSLVILKSMRHAEYLSESRGHYALATDHYCHFTSPIRRFPDLIVHSVLKERDLEAAARKPFDWAAHLDGYCRASSDMEIVAERAEREVVKVKLLRFLSDRIGEVMHGVVVSVEEFGAFVELEEVPVDGLVSVRKMRERLTLDRRAHTLSDARGRFRLRLGDRVQVTIEAIDLARRELDLRLVR